MSATHDRPGQRTTNTNKEQNQTMSTIVIPATIDEATNRLGDLGTLATATDWERAAILATYVRLDNPPGPQDRSEVTDLTPAEFAGLGIVGLRSKNTVRRYVKAWLDEHGNVPPRPGAKRRLPTSPFPASDPMTPRATASNMARQLADPDVRRQVLDKLDGDDRHTLEELALDAADAAADAAGFTRDRIPVPADDTIEDPFQKWRHDVRGPLAFLKRLIDDPVATEALKDDDGLRSDILNVAEQMLAVAAVDVPDTIEGLV